MNIQQYIQDSVQRAFDACVTKLQAVWMEANEEWITGDELCKQFSMITPKMLKNHGELFPRRRITMTGQNGVRKCTRWAYPRHRIAMNISRGVYDEMEVMKDL